MYTKKDLTPPTEALKCPVCKGIIDYRLRSEHTFAYCEECKTRFFYPANASIPTAATPDSLNKKRGCGCGHCSR